MKNKVVQRILVIAIVAAIVVGASVGGVHYQKNSRTAEVYAVSQVMDNWWGDEVMSSGQVTNDESQSVEISSDSIIKSVLVTEGQQVAVGDALLEMDVTDIELQLNMKKLEVQNVQNQIDIAQNELKKWKDMKPVSNTQRPATAKKLNEKTGNAYNYVKGSATPYNQATADGSAANPFRYLCTEKAYITGEKILALASANQCAVFEVHQGNTETGAVVSSWTIDGSQCMLPDASTCWLLSDRSQVFVEVGYEVEAETPAVEEVGYTKEEIDAQVADYNQKLKELDLEKRKAQLEVDKLSASYADGFVYATVDGVVKNVQSVDEIDYAKPFLEVAGSEGLYVTGYLSELLLDSVEPGQSITVYSWESGISKDAEIVEIMDYPSENGSSYGGDGNPNVSYYPYKAYIADTTGLRNGEYVDLTMTIGGGDGGSLYITKAYVRSDEGGSYVFKADENDRLVKQYVQTGRTIYGQSVEIKSGLTTEDRIAFPYGKTAKEGVRTVDSEVSYW